MICFLKVSPAAFDGRLKKYFKACKSENVPFIAVTWDRLMSGVYEEGEIAFKKQAPFGYGHRVRNLFYLLSWYAFALRILFKKRKEYEIIHACNLVTILIAYPVKILLRKKIVFDIFDTTKKYKLEQFFARHSDIFILPHDNRLEQIGLRKEELKSFIVIENTPLFPLQDYIHEGLKSEDIIRLSYVGSFERINRGLENLLTFVKNDHRFLLDIAGSGDNMDYLFEEASSECDRIKYYGRVSNLQGVEIMRRSDFIVALYYLTSPGHKYAAPNKIYESLYLSVPVITSNNTLAGKMVENYNSGYVIDDTYDAMEKLFANIDDKFKEEYHKKEENARKVWNEKYANYLEETMVNGYLNTCRSILE